MPPRRRSPYPVSAQMPAAPPVRRGDFDGSVRIRRRRRLAAVSAAEKRAEIVERVLGFYQQDVAARTTEAEMRLQRYAKYRMWTEGKEWPWPNSADTKLPDLMTHVQRTEDTLVNAVMSGMPPVAARAVDPKDRAREATVDRVITHQLMIDQPGSQIIGDLAHNFVAEGVGTLYLPWVKETAKTTDKQIIEPPGPGSIPGEWFRVRVEGAYPKAKMITPSADGWDYRIETEDGRKVEVSFYTADDGSVEMLTSREADTFDGPCWIVKAWEDVLKPVRSRNLQRPGPSNPTGAAHVILVDRDVTIDEIDRLRRSGFYDLLGADDVERMEGTSKAPDEEGLQDQKDALKGHAPEAASTPPGAEAHKTLTRLVCFDVFDVDGDGIAEDVIWWVIVETKQLARVRLLTEMYPMDPPLRPLFSQDFLPDGMSLIEMLEGTHDAVKQQLDMTIDVGALTGIPFFGYRATGGMKPETLTIEPGIGIPLQDPQRDIAFPQMPTSQISTGINLITLLNQMQERTSMQGELQFGRVPQGKASALRTLGGMQSVMSQGEARPERILGRFFTLLCSAFRFVHEMNRRFLPPGKVVRVVGFQPEGERVYETIGDRNALGGAYTFEFKANAFNTSRQALQMGLGAVMPIHMSPLAFQLGITTPETAYRLIRDFDNAHGLDPDSYTNPPTAEAMKPRILAEEAITAIMQGQAPYGVPLEPGGWAEHLEKLLAFTQTEQFGFLDPAMGLVGPEALERFKGWVAEVRQRMLADARRQAVLQAAAEVSGQGGGQGGPPGTPQSAADAQANPQISGGAEMLDESMPSAGGGANPGMMQ